MKHSAILFFLLFKSLLLVAQSEAAPENVPQKGILLKKEWSAGITLSTLGWGVVAERVRIPSEVLKRVVQINIYNTRHVKELKTTVKNASYLGSNFKSFYYAKINSLYSINLLKGWRYKWARKADKNGVDIYGSLLGGFVLGIAKPYSLQLEYNDDDIRTEIYGQSDNQNRFLDLNKIQGYGGFWKGLQGIRPYPGASVKAGLFFDFGKNDQVIKAAEVSLAADFYYKNIPLMALYKNNFVYPRMMLSFQLGKRGL